MSSMSQDALAPSLHPSQTKVSVTTARLLLKRTGTQFLLADLAHSSTALLPSSAAVSSKITGVENSGAAAEGACLDASQDEPLIVRMSRDDPAHDKYFFSALESFVSR